jgi:sulfide dehydrogenase [flavocytochrome c] flavoprotein subunit
MNKQTFNLSERRRTLLLAAAALGMGMLPFAARPDDDEKGASKSSRKSGSTSGSISVPETGPTGKVVVIGGGMAGATAAKYLRLWGGVNVSVTLVEPDTAYTSNIMSNLVLNGSRTVTTLQYSLAALTTKYGVVRKQAALLSIDPIRKTVTLSDQSTLSYDRLVLAPGVEFDNAYGLTQTDYDTSTPHAWRAGAQTTLLQKQLASVGNGGVFVMTIPKAPYRCPPGPYERACLVADYLKTQKGPDAKVYVLDQNLSIQAEVDNFTKAFNVIHAGVINYQPGVTGIQIDPRTKGVSYTDQMGVARVIQRRPSIPFHRTGPPEVLLGVGWLQPG